MDKLEKTHAGNYTQEQPCAWAHMNDMKKHSSYDIPPQKPFLNKSMKQSRHPLAQGNE